MIARIDSEEQIPEEFRSHISDSMDISTTITITPGVLGGRVASIEEAFSNSSNYYFGHGTNAGDDIIKKILAEGLAVIDPEAVKGYMDTLRGLDSTTIPFGPGSEELFEKREELLNNWPHKDAKKIVIVTLPSKYVLDPSSCKYGIDYFETYYTGNEETGYKLRPEFILGVYNADEKSMRLNSNYYANLSEENQEKLFEEVEEKYAISYAFYGIEEPKKDKFTNETNYKKSALLWYKNQFEILKDEEERQRQIQNIADDELTIAGLDDISDDDTDWSSFNWEDWEDNIEDQDKKSM